MVKEAAKRLLKYRAQYQNKEHTYASEGSQYNQDDLVVSKSCTDADHTKTRDACNKWSL